MKDSEIREPRKRLSAERTQILLKWDRLDESKERYLREQLGYIDGMLKALPRTKVEKALGGLLILLILLVAAWFGRSFLPG